MPSTTTNAVHCSGAIRPIGAGQEPVDRGEHEHRDTEDVHTMPQLAREAAHRPRRDLDREKEVGREDAPRDCVRTPRRRERHEELLRRELDERVEPDRADVDDDEHDGQRAEVAVQVEDPRGHSPLANELRRGQEAPHDRSRDDDPGHDPRCSSDPPPDAGVDRRGHALSQHSVR